MPIVDRFAPPAYLSDFNSIRGQLDAWHEAVSDWFDAAIRDVTPQASPGPCQFYNPAHFDPGGAVLPQEITWNAFPKELVRQFGRESAMREADTLWPLDRYYSVLCDHPIDPKMYPLLAKTYTRPQHEYCEWHVEREQETGKIVRVTFTSEPPEFWCAFFGGSIPDDGHKFPGDRDAVLGRYRDLVSPGVALSDLIAQDDIASPDGFFARKGEYNVYNKWNTTDGIMHLCAPPNSLVAEIYLGADATVLRGNAAGRLLVEPEALICCGAFGGPDRNSDPTIGAVVNAAARLGAYVTLKDPVGLYMDHIDLSGWEVPDGRSVVDCVRIVRGAPKMIERMIDKPLHGEIKLAGMANIPKDRLRNQPVKCEGRCWLDRNNPIALVRSVPLGTELPPPHQQAFSDEGAEELRETTKNQAPTPATSRVLRLRRRGL